MKYLPSISQLSSILKKRIPNPGQESCCTIYKILTHSNHFFLKNLCSSSS